MAQTILCISLTLSHNHGKLSCLSQQISLRQAGRLCKHEFQTLSDKKTTLRSCLQVTRLMPISRYAENYQTFNFSPLPCPEVSLQMKGLGLNTMRNGRASQPQCYFLPVVKWLPKTKKEFMKYPNYNCHYCI